MKKDCKGKESLSGVTLAHLETKEEIFVNTTLKQFASERGLSYKSLNQLVNNKIKSSGGWYLKKLGEPVYVSQKDTKRKSLSEEHKNKILTGFKKSHNYNKVFINIKDPNQKIVIKHDEELTSNSGIEKYKLDPRKVRRVIYGEIKVLNGEWILEENYEKYIAENEICKICYKGYKNTDSLRNHLKRQHKIKQEDFCKFYNVKKVDKSKEKKPIDQFDKNTGLLIKTWASSFDAGRTLKINEGCVRNAAKGHLSTYKQSIWRFHNEADRKKYLSAAMETNKNNKIFYWDVEKKQEVFIDDQETTRIIKTFCYYNKMAVDKERVESFRLYKGKLYFFEKHFNKENFIKLYNSMPVVCKECCVRFHKNQPLTSHLASVHNMSSEQYTIKHFYSGSRPFCKVCNNETRYTSFSFKEYCISHSGEAMSTGGTIGGKAPAWSRGLTKEDDLRLMEYSKKYSGEGNPFYGKNHTKEMKKEMSELKKLTEQEIINRLQIRSDDFDFQFNYEEYYSRQHQKIICICKKCDRKQEKTLQALERDSLCKYCYPFIMSKEEIKIGDFIEYELGIKNVIRNDRSVIAPKELDIYLPDYNVAIEYNGIYWHSELNKEDRYFHYQKNQDCLQKGINLISIDEDHWRDQQDLIKSIIRHAVKKSPNRIPARKCVVEKTKNEQRVKDFFNTNHISGHANAMQVFLLTTKDTGEIVSGLTLRKAFHKKYKECMEIGRFATKSNTSVPGAFTKLLKQAIEHVKKNHPEKLGLISYCDLAFGNGNVYDKNGFVKEGRTKSKEINFFYTDGKIRYNRFDFRAQPGKSEKTVASEAGVYKIYGCGNSLYKLSIDE
jgi:predicted GNAT family N-acyltransferase